MEERAPLNLDALGLKELLDRKKSRLEKMKSLESEIDKINEEGGRLVAALAAYDEQRLKIAEIMPELIERYAISAPLSETLMRYTQTPEDSRMSIKSSGQSRLVINRTTSVWHSLCLHDVAAGKF